MTEPHPYEAAIALVQVPGAFASMGVLPQSPPFLIYLDGMDEPLAWPLTAAQAAEILTMYPSGSIDASKIRTDLDDGYNALLNTMYADVTEHLAPTGEIVIMLSHMVIDSVGDNAMLQLRPTNDEAIDTTLTFGSMIVLLPSIHKGGVLTYAYGNETATFDVETSVVETAFASTFLGTSISSALITAGRRVALIYRMVYEEEHEGMRHAPPSHDAAIAAFTALAQSPFDWAQRIGRRVACSEERYASCLDLVKPIDKGLVHVLLATKCFDVAVASIYSKNHIEYATLYPACNAPDEVVPDHLSLDLVLPAPDEPDEEPENMLVFWPKHHRVTMADRTDALTYLATMLLQDAPCVVHHGNINGRKDGAAPVQEGFLGITDVDVVLRSTMMAFAAHRGLEQRMHTRKRHPRRTQTPLGTLSRLLAHQNDLELTFRFIADIVSIQDDVPASEVALWLHGLLTTHGWGPFQPALVQLLTRWSNENADDALHLFASFLGLADEPLCPPLRLPHEAELLKRCWPALYGGVIAWIRAWHQGSAFYTHCLLLEAYVTKTAPQLPEANYVGHRLPPPLVSMVDAFALPLLLAWTPLLLSGRPSASDIAVGVALALQRDPCVPTGALIEYVLRAYGKSFKSEDSYYALAAGLDAAGSILFLALRENRLDDDLFRHVTQCWTVGLLPVARAIVAKHPALVSPSFASRMAAYILTLAPLLAEKEVSYDGRGGKVYAPATLSQHELVRDAIELLRLFAPTQLPTLVDAWLEDLPTSLEVTDAVLLPLAALVLEADAPLCSKLLQVAATRPPIVDDTLYHSGSDDEWPFDPPSRAEKMRYAKDRLSSRITTTIADLTSQLATKTQVDAPAPKRQRC